MFSSAKNRIICIGVACAMMISFLCVFARQMFPDSKLIFEGLTMTAAGETIQTFVDVKLSDVEGAGVGFTLQYNSNYIVPSRASDNTPIASEGFGDDFLEFDTDNFPTGCFVQDLIGHVSPSNNQVEVNLMPDPTAEDSGPYIKNATDDNGDDLLDDDGYPTKIIDATGDPILLVRISFQVVDPAGLAQLSASEFAKVFTIPKDEDNENQFSIGYIDVEASTFPDAVIYNEDEHLGFEFNVVNSVIKAETNIKNPIITAEEVYEGSIGKTGTEQDLIDYANSHYQNLTVEYASGAMFADVITWGDLSKNFTLRATDSSVWDGKGGHIYKLSQNYNDDIVVELFIDVQMVTVTSYTSDNDYMVYSESDAPSDLAGLLPDMPTKANAVFDKAVNGTYSAEIHSDTWTEVPEDFKNKVRGEYTFTANVNTSELPIWATVNVDTVSVIRAIGDRTGNPVVSASTDSDGVMTITVQSLGADVVPSGTEFVIRMPNGMIIDEQWFDGTSSDTYFTVNLDSPSVGEAQIVIAVASTDAAENANLELLKEYINLGNRAPSSFEIAADDPETEKFRSEWVAFVSNPRENEYTGGNDGTNYLFDYTTEAGKNLMSYSINAAGLPITISLPAGGGVTTTYSGANGREPGFLSTITVKAWNMSGTLSLGEIVEFTGTLEDTSYAGYGDVVNNDGKTVTLKLIVNDKPINESIKDIPDFVFDTQQEGYGADKLQTAWFEIVNTSLKPIPGLTVSISGDDANLFMMNANPAYQVGVGGKAVFSIGTKQGLPSDEYTATVTIGSINTAVLDTFTITFKVVKDEVYFVNVVNDEPAWGTAQVVGSRTYCAGDEVILSAVPANEDYTFEEWQAVTPSDLVFIPDANDPDAVFTMPASDVEVKAIFKESPAAKLRLSALKVQNPVDDSEDILRADDATMIPIVFDPSTMKYLVCVQSAREQSKMAFQLLHTDVEGEAVNVAVTHSELSDPITVTMNAGVYETDAFALLQMPTENLLTITLTCGSYHKDYTIRIYRAVDVSDRAEYFPGNSPYGLIMSDDVITEKEAAKAAFDANYNKYDPNFVPAGGNAAIHYVADAWGNTNGSSSYTNYDKDESAVFVYNGTSSFRIPKVKKLVNSLGEEVADYTKVKVSIGFNVLDTFDPSKPLSSDFGVVTSETLVVPACDADGSVLISGMQQWRIRPDIYWIEYLYEDFDGSTIAAKRPLIVLAANGDVNVDGTQDALDAKAIKGRYHDRLPYESLASYATGYRLYKYRICDVNVDGDINNADAACISNPSVIQKYYPDLPSV